MAVLAKLMHLDGPLATNAFSSAAQWEEELRGEGYADTGGTKGMKSPAAQYSAV